MCDVMLSEAGIIDRNNDNEDGPEKQDPALDMPPTTMQVVVVVMCVSVVRVCAGGGGIRVINTLMRGCSGRRVGERRLLGRGGWWDEDGGGRDSAGADEHLPVGGWDGEGRVRERERGYFFATPSQQMLQLQRQSLPPAPPPPPWRGIDELAHSAPSATYIMEAEQKRGGRVSAFGDQQKEIRVAASLLRAATRLHHTSHAYHQCTHSHSVVRTRARCCW